MPSCTAIPGWRAGRLPSAARSVPVNYFWLEVEDEGGPWTPAVADPERGHGLDIMRSLADDWGIEGDHDGRTVWARFDWPSP